MFPLTSQAKKDFKGKTFLFFGDWFLQIVPFLPLNQKDLSWSGKNTYFILHHIRFEEIF